MGNVLKSILGLACAAMLSGNVAAMPVEPKAECKNNTCEKFRVGMYRIKNTLTMNFLMEKQKGEKVTVQLIDAKGKVLHQELVGKSMVKFGRKFNFSEMQDGHYTLEVSDDKERIVKNIFLRSNEVMEVQARTLVSLN
jgi:hypothetical protein